MKLTVLVPSEEYRSYAGARIRYGRLAPELELLGIDLKLADIGNFDRTESSGDALLISKCHDARSLVAAAAARRRGQLVGVDLFDDYFSQRSDSRLTRFRNWLIQLQPIVDFALCSTRRMAEVAQSYRSDLPVHVVNDPAPPLNFEELPRLLVSKLGAVRSEQTMRLAWFGVGDNPHFRVGLSDLAAFAGPLRQLAKGGLDVRLTVLTNARALTADGLALITSLPLPTEIGEWSEERELHLLASSFACFLPVNAQPFSAAKSLNRAVTALSAGCQVISAGYPLYAALDEFIYRDLEVFLSDIAAGSMKHSAARLQRYNETIQKIASPSGEAAVLAQFLDGLEPARNVGDGPLVLVQGQSPNGLAHKAVKALRGLSVASPYCAPGLGFDVVFRGASGGPVMYVSEGSASRLEPELRRRLDSSATISERKFWLVPETGASATDASDSEWHGAPLPFQLATYRPTMVRIRERMEAAFGPCQFLVSENSQLPFSPEL